MKKLGNIKLYITLCLVLSASFIFLGVEDTEDQVQISKKDVVTFYTIENLLHTLSVKDAPPYFTEKRHDISEHDFSSDYKVVVTAEDGTRVIVRQRDKKFFLVLCQHENHVLGIIPSYKATENKIENVSSNNFDLVKVDESDNVSVYSLNHDITRNDKSNPQSLICWMDTKYDKYCGGIGVNPVPIRVKTINESDTEYYNYTKNAHTYMADYCVTLYEDAVKKYSLLYEAEPRYPLYINPYIWYISNYDKEFAEKLSNRYEDLRTVILKYSNEERFSNQRLLMKYTSPVWQINNRSNRAERKSLIEGELPVTELELKEYIGWVSAVFNKELPLKDYYGTELRFDLEKEGVRVFSAGYDKQFDTDDDQTYLSRYDEINITRPVTEPKLI